MRTARYVGVVCRWLAKSEQHWRRLLIAYFDRPAGAAPLHLDGRRAEELPWHLAKCEASGGAQYARAVSLWETVDCYFHEQQAGELIRLWGQVDEMTPVDLRRDVDVDIDAL